MQRKILNERGLSLVELMAVVVLFSIFSIIIWQFFFQATEINSREVKQSTLQQEANLIMNTVHQIHTKEEIQNIDTSDDKKQLIITIKDKEPIIFNRTDILYEVYLQEENRQNSFFLKLKLISSKNKNIDFSTQSIFSKL